jgi:uncharacterized protein YbaP (TraB family)
MNYSYTRTYILLFFLLLSTSVLRAQSNDRSRYQLLWRIDGPGISAPSYLFGTMHLTDKRVFDFSDSVLVALRNANGFAMEVDMDSAMSFMLSPDGPLLDTTNHLRRLLNEDEYRYVDSLVKQKTGSPLQAMKVKRLWFVEKLLIDEEEALKEHAPNSQNENIFLDGWLHQKATGLTKPVYSLERIQNQLHMMSADASEMQKEMFLANLGYYGDAQEKSDLFNARISFLDSLVNLYYNADMTKIANLVNTIEDSEHEEDGPGLSVRNIEMVDNLSALVRKGSIFAAVGVAHLPGDRGMIALLRKKGFTVSPVKATFTGVTKKERHRLDSLKGFSLNRIAEGFSIMLPGVPVSYPLPNMNRKMYVGSNNDEAGFAFCMDIPQLDTNNTRLVNAMINSMAARSNAKLQKSYPITYRNVQGTEAIMRQESGTFYIRLFIRNKRIFVFMHGVEGKADVSRSRDDFFKSLRFYEIARPVTVYDTLNFPKYGFSAVMPKDANFVETGKSSTGRPEEIYSAIDSENSISYVLRIEKMKRGYYNDDDRKMLADFRSLLYQQDSTLHVIDSTVTEKDGLPLYQIKYKHAHGYVSRLQYIARGNLGYCVYCMYDERKTDSSYWKRFFDAIKITPLQATAPVIPFTAPDSSFTVKGPELFTGGLLEDAQSSAVNIDYYKSMDSTSHAMYLVEVDRYSRYYSEDPDSMMERLSKFQDSNFVVVSKHNKIENGLPVYESELKGTYTHLRWFRKVIVVGHTVYNLGAIEPEEVVSKNYSKQFFASFTPGRKEKMDTLRLKQKKTLLLLKHLQGTDTALVNKAEEYLENFRVDSTEKKAVITALGKPFPADTGEHQIRVELLNSLENVVDGEVVHVAEQLFKENSNAEQRRRIINFLSRIPSDSSIRTLLRLAPELPMKSTYGGLTINYSFKQDSLYKRYLLEMIATAEKSPTFLNEFVQYTRYDSLWFSPQFEKYELNKLTPKMVTLFDYHVKQWKERDTSEHEDWLISNPLESVGRLLSLPGMPESAVPGFKQLLADTVISIRSIGARGLIGHGIKVDDKMLRSIIDDKSASYSFITDMKEDDKLSQIKHLLTPENVSRSYVTNYLEEDDYLVAIEQVTKVKVKDGKSFIFFRYKTEEDGDWQYLFHGPVEQSKINLDTYQEIYWIEDAEVIKDKKKLAAEAAKAYQEYLDNKSEE